MEEETKITAEEKALKVLETKALMTPDERTFDLIQRKAQLLSSSDLVPTQYQGGSSKAIANCIIAQQLAHRMGADELMVMQNLYVIHGKPSWSSQFIISAINSCGRFSPLNFIMEGEGLKLSCKATATEKATGNIISGPTVTMEMAKAEGWIDKSGSKWKTMPELMIRYRAASFFGKLYAPEILNGMGTVEEIIDSEPVDVTPKEQPETMSTAEKVKDKLKKSIKPEVKPENTPDPEPETELDIF